MANGINPQQDPRKILGQLIQQSQQRAQATKDTLDTAKSSAAKKVLDKFLTTQAEEALSQEGGQETLAGFIQQEVSSEQNTSTSVPDQKPKDNKNTINNLLVALGSGLAAAGGNEQLAPSLVSLVQSREAQKQKDVNASLKLAQEEAKSGLLTPNNIFTKFEPIANDFQSIVDSFARVEASAEDPSAAGDLALIFNYMKVLDPDSVVRESEFATAQNAPGVPDRVRAAYNRVINGERFTPGVREDFRGRAEKLFRSKERQFKQQRKNFIGLAKRNKINPENIIRDVSLVRKSIEKEISGMSDEDLIKISGEK